ncbi:MAG: ATP-grasp domain-containing protein [Candidatus Zixiibacteriota bacterium]
MPDGRVLVVGTTSDYIDLISRRYPERALFVTDALERRKARELPPSPGNEVLVDLRQSDAVYQSLVAHLSEYHLKLNGVACYDCESMALAADLAGRFGLAYPSVESIHLLRDKFRTKQIWQERGVNCPRAVLVRSERDVLRFADSVGYPIVLKPLTGSGSELTFRCDDRKQCLKHYSQVKSGLGKLAGSRMYSIADAEVAAGTMQPAIVTEKLVEGPEYSCDFIIEGDTVRIIRIAGKIRSCRLTFGTTLAYLLPARLPDGLDTSHLAGKLRDASKALGIDRAVCMVDFIMHNKRPCFLELTPRPGGDCLPPLIMRSCGLDMLGVALDFAESRPVSAPPEAEWTRLVGARMFARQEGMISRLDTGAVQAHPAVVECWLKRSPGHVVTLPPEDYESWLLGHVIFKPSSLHYHLLERESEAIVSRLAVDFETRHEQKLRGLLSPHRRAAEAADTAA